MYGTLKIVDSLLEQLCNGNVLNLNIQPYTKSSNTHKSNKIGVYIISAENNNDYLLVKYDI